MSTSVESIQILRSSTNNHYQVLQLSVVANGQKFYYDRSSESGLSEAEAALEITERFVELHKFARMKAKILRYFEALR